VLNAALRYSESEWTQFSNSEAVPADAAEAWPDPSSSDVNASDLLGALKAGLAELGGELVCLQYTTESSEFERVISGEVLSSFLIPPFAQERAFEN